MAVAAEPLGILEDMRNPSYRLTALLLAMTCAVIGQSLTARAQSFVTPQLVSTIDGAILLAPDGSLWLWGGNHRQNLNPGCLGTTEVTDRPEGFIIDPAPFVLWELPSKVRGSLREGVGK